MQDLRSTGPRRRGPQLDVGGFLLPTSGPALRAAELVYLDRRDLDPGVDLGHGDRAIGAGLRLATSAEEDHALVEAALHGRGGSVQHPDPARQHARPVALFA